MWRCNLHDMHFLIVASGILKLLLMFATGDFGWTKQAMPLHNLSKAQINRCDFRQTWVT